MFDILKYATLDTERTASDQASAEKAAEAARATAVGQSFLSGANTVAALAAGEDAYQAEVSHFRTWYTFDPDVIYPAVLDWLEANRAALAAYLGRSDADLVTLALNGDEIAHFTLKARQTVAEVTALSADGFHLARRGRDEFSGSEDVGDLEVRERALEAARHFFTEALHQSHLTAKDAAGLPVNTNAGIGVKILAGDKRWALLL